MNSFFQVRRSYLFPSFYTARVNMNGVGVQVLLTDDFGNLVIVDQDQFSVSTKA